MFNMKIISNLIYYTQNTPINEESFGHILYDFIDKLIHGHIGTKEALGYLTNFLSGLWNYPLVSIEGKTLKIANIILGVLLLIIAFRLAAKIRLLIRKRLIKINTLQKSARKGIENISYYIILVLITFFALELANIPLTIFTLVGGALAIGIGFGSQNVIQNFISGLILMLEQKIRVGDFIEIDGVSGTVIDIGARCTQIISPDNIDIIVPNSNLLDKQIVNWSLTEDGIIRTNVEFQLENDIMNCELIESKIEQILLKHENIIQSKGITIYINSLSGNSLNYQAYFYLDMFGLKSRRAIVTEIYKAIAREFVEHNIKFANPINNLSKLLK